MVEGEAVSLKAFLALPSVSLDEVCWGLSGPVLAGGPWQCAGAFVHSTHTWNECPQVSSPALVGTEDGRIRRQRMAGEAERKSVKHGLHLTAWFTHLQASKAFF